MAAVLAVLLTTTSERFYSSLAFIWEASPYITEFLPIIEMAHAAGELKIVSTLPTADEYIASAQKHYSYDHFRYPMYFKDVSPALLALGPDLLKTEDTTMVLGQQLRMWAEGTRDGAWGALSAVDAKSLDPVRRYVGPLLDRRDRKAITLTLFQHELDRKILSNSRLPMARLLSLLHLRHYLDHIGADITTGVPQLAYFDNTANTFPILDLSLLSSMLRSMRVSSVDLCHPRELETIVALRRSAIHGRFVDALRFLLNAAVYRVWRKTGLSDCLAQRDLVSRELEMMLHRGSWPLVQMRIASHLDRLSGELEKVALLASREPDLLEFSARLEREATTNRKRVLILTATALETRTVSESILLRFGTNVTKAYLDDHTIHLCGQIGHCDIYLVQSEMGTVSPSAMTLTAIDVVDVLRPDSVILVGIAFGLRPQNQKIGDVLVSRQMSLYDPKKLTEIKGNEAWLPRGDRPQASTRLLDRFQSGSLDWNLADVHFGLLLSGNTLVNSPTFVEALKTLEPDAIGGEMEGAGVYAVSAKRKVDWIVVKGIADWGVNKLDEGQKLAAINATGLVLHVIASGGLSV